MGESAFKHAAVAFVSSRFEGAQCPRTGKQHAFTLGTLLELMPAELRLAGTLSLSFTLADLFFYRLAFPTTRHASIIA